MTRSSTSPSNGRWFGGHAAVAAAVTAAFHLWSSRRFSACAETGHPITQNSYAGCFLSSGRSRFAGLRAIQLHQHGPCRTLRAYRHQHFCCIAMISKLDFGHFARKPNRYLSTVWRKNVSLRGAFSRMAPAFPTFRKARAPPTAQQNQLLARIVRSGKWPKSS